jgi:xylulokinase
MRGAWVGFSWGHTQAHFFRAILESVAFEYAYYLRILRDRLPDLKLLQTRVAGGGARSRVWNQIKADVLDVPYQPLARGELGTWGSALIAGYAVGLFANLAETAYAAAGADGAMVQPQAKAAKAYEPLTDQYIAWQSALHQAFNLPGAV